MADRARNPERTRPVLGGLSIGISVVVFLTIVCLVLDAYHSAASDEASFTRFVSDVTISFKPIELNWMTALIAAGIVSAILGVVRGEGYRGIHVAGLILNPLAPFVGVQVLKFYFG